MKRQITRRIAPLMPMTLITVPFNIEADFVAGTSFCCAVDAMVRRVCGAM